MIVSYKQARIRKEAAEGGFRGLLVQSPEDTEETQESLRMDFISNICGVPISFNVKLMFVVVNSLDNARQMCIVGCVDFRWLCM